METMAYSECLKNGRIEPLEKLAKMAGYNERFDPIRTEILTVINNRENLFQNKEVWDSEKVFWDSTGHLKSYSNAPQKYRNMIVKYMKNNSPRAHWNNEYENLFTGLKEDGSFLDLWRDKENQMFALAKGKFPRNGDKNYNSNVDEETNMLLHISSIRSKYPPFSPWKEIVGIPNTNNKTEKVMYFITKRILDIGIGGMTFHLTKNAPATIGAVVLLEYGLYKILEHQGGTKCFDELGVKLDSAAINELIGEIN